MLSVRVANISDGVQYYDREATKYKFVLNRLNDFYSRKRITHNHVLKKAHDSLSLSLSLSFFLTLYTNGLIYTDKWSDNQLIYNKESNFFAITITYLKRKAVCEHIIKICCLAFFARQQILIMCSHTAISFQIRNSYRTGQSQSTIWDIFSEFWYLCFLI